VFVISCALAEKDYGFIARADGPDALVPYLRIDGYGFHSLEGLQVEFEETQGQESTGHQCPRRTSGARDRKL
jgi:cold shock CspA family protein